jgi:hypothetical protein
VTADSTVTGFETVRVVAIAGGGRASFLRCSFTGNTIVPSFPGSGVLMARGTDAKGIAQVRLWSLSILPIQGYEEHGWYAVCTIC